MSRFLTWCHTDADGHIISRFYLFQLIKMKLVLGDNVFVGSESKSPLYPRDDFFKSNNCH